MATSSSGRPGWQRNSVFKFFASIKLAVVLLAVLILAAIAGTIWESSFDAKVARAYVYGAPWFNFWLLLLVANLAMSALSRWPWKKHHVAFLITHLGIITLLFGSLIGRIWGTEGTITLFKGDPPTSRLLVDEHQLRVRDTDGIIKGYAAEFINHPPTPGRPRDLGPLASGARLSIVEYANAVESKLNPKPLESGGVPALHFTINTAMMGQRLESWLLADDPQHGTFEMGLAKIELKRGLAPAASSPNESKPTEETDIEESIFAFAKSPDQQVGRAVKGGSSGAKVTLSPPENGDSGTVTITLGDKTWRHDVAAHLQQETPLEGSPFAMRIEGYWPDFRIENGRPTSVSDQPNNPAVFVTLRGRAVPVSPPADAHAAGGNEPQDNPSANRLTLFMADDGAITYELTSRKAGHSSGKLELNAPLPTGWADWTLAVDETMPHAEQWMDFTPVDSATASGPTANLPDGVRVRVQQGSTSIEQWIPAGWQIAVPTQPAPIQVSYGWRQQQLPIALELIDFEVKRNEGSDSPAGFKSTVRVTDREGRSAPGQCWMNNPFSYPSDAWRVWTGLTYKMSQASWNPENLGQSTIQILRDPGWLLKWVGSLLVCSGIFMLFYVKKFRRPTAAASPTERPSRKPNKSELVGVES